MTILAREFEKDAGDRLAAMMKGTMAGSLLAPAAALAGQQLEFLSPVIMGAGGKRGFYGGKVVQVTPRTVLLVAADTKQVFTAHYVVTKGSSAADMIAAALAEVEEDLPGFLRGKDPAAAAPHMIDYFLEKFGAAPGAKGPQCDDPVMMTRLLGFLMHAVPPAERYALVKVFDVSLDAAVCPAWVWLKGPASSGKPDLCSIKSLILPVAPYMQDFVGEMEGG